MVGEIVSLAEDNEKERLLDAGASHEQIAVTLAAISGGVFKTSGIPACVKLVEILQLELQPEQNLGFPPCCLAMPGKPSISAYIK
jgi:hypothetical protein